VGFLFWFIIFICFLWALFIPSWTLSTKGLIFSFAGGIIITFQVLSDLAWELVQETLKNFNTKKDDENALRAKVSNREILTPAEKERFWAYIREAFAFHWSIRIYGLWFMFYLKFLGSVTWSKEGRVNRFILNFLGAILITVGFFLQLLDTFKMKP